ncbi:MAG: D-glycerate dehydrogenase [bacterium]|nr:D-glycerate dehydrogenase [bacterium]
MKRLSVFLASRLLEEIQRDFDEAFDTIHVDTREPARNLAEMDSSFDALLVSIDTPLPAREIEMLPDSVRAIATYSVGTDHIDLAAAKRRGIAVFNTPGVLSDSVAENAIFLMLGAARRATESITLLRSGAWEGWSATQLVGTELFGKRLGIVGLGDIGGRIALRAQAFGMEILYTNRKPLPANHHVRGHFFDSPAALIAESDIFLLACPSTPETLRLVDARLLARARPGLILVNIARGDLVDDEALIEALRDGRVGAAGLDVFSGEPEVDPAFFGLPNLFMLPHIGSSTIEARRRMGKILIAALESWAQGGSPKSQVCG